MEGRQQFRSFASIAVQFSIFLGVTVAQSSSGARTSIGSESTTTMVPAAVQSTLPFCPMQEKGPVPRSENEAGLVAQPQPAGPHQVILSWNGSSDLPKHSAAPGYCLYRSKQIGGTKENPIFGEPERINLVSLPGTTCIDKFVQNGVTYRYIVTAVNWNSGPSLRSNEAFATIPSDPPTPTESSGSSSARVSCSELSAPLDEPGP